MRHSRSMVLLACGRLEEGWATNAARLDPNRAQATLFTIDAPMWDGVDPAQIRGKTLVLVGEQGLGDEVLFMNTVKDLIEAIGPDGELRIDDSIGPCLTEKEGELARGRLRLLYRLRLRLRQS